MHMYMNASTPLYESIIMYASLVDAFDPSGGGGAHGRESVGTAVLAIATDTVHMTHGCRSRGARLSRRATGAT